MNESPGNEQRIITDPGNEQDRAYHVQKALSKHDIKAMRKLMKDRTRALHNPRKFNIDKLPDYEAVTDRRKRRKAKAEDGTE